MYTDSDLSVSKLNDNVIVFDASRSKGVTPEITCSSASDVHSLDRFVDTLSYFLVKYQTQLNIDFEESGDAEVISAFFFQIILYMYLLKEGNCTNESKEGLCLYPCFYRNAG